MQVQWTSLLLAVALLLPPIPLSASIRKFLKSHHNSTTSIRSLLGIWQNWADLIRAGVGVFLLMEWAIQLSPAVKGAGAKAIMFQGTILGVSLLFQIVRFIQGPRLVAPIFYLCGFTMVLGGYAAGGFAVFAGWLFVIERKSPTFQLPIMGVALVAAGFLLGLNLRLLLACGFTFAPFFFGFLFNQPLAFVARERMVAAP